MPAMEKETKEMTLHQKLLDNGWKEEFTGLYRAPDGEGLYNIDTAYYKLSRRQANNSTRKDLQDRLFMCLSDYLVSCGWILDGRDFHFIDPITNAHHRSDFALFIQTERDAMEIYNKK